MSEKSVIVIGPSEEQLSRLTTAELRTQGIHVLEVAPSTLGSLKVSLQDNLFRVEKQIIGGILFRVSPDSSFSHGFQADDRLFCDAEIRAVWLAALNLDSILAINRYDAQTWFEGIGWLAMRRKLMQTDIPMSNFMFGDNILQPPGHWYPFASHKARRVPSPYIRRALGTAITKSRPDQINLIVQNEIITGKQAPTVLTIAEFFTGIGIHLVEVTTDNNDKVLMVNTQPEISDLSSAKRISRQLARMYHAHLYNR